MMAAMNPPTTDPAVIYRTRDAIAAADALAAAIVHLDLFTGLARAPADLAEVCRRHGLHPRPTDVLCTLLSAQGLLARDASGRFEPTATAREFLVDAAPFDARSYYAAMADKPGVADFIQVLRTGRPANWPGAEGEADWHASMRTEAFAEAFTAAMDCRGRVLAPALATAVDGGAARRLLDVGGGSGVYSIAMAERFPTLAATVLEAAPSPRSRGARSARRAWKGAWPWSRPTCSRRRGPQGTTCICFQTSSTTGTRPTAAGSWP
jgi:hypothetical protein